MKEFYVVILTMAVPILLLAIWLISARRIDLKALNRESESETDQSAWYDQEGNHIYYDRKLIRYRQRRQQKLAASQKGVLTDKQPNKNNNNNDKE